MYLNRLHHRIDQHSDKIYTFSKKSPFAKQGQMKYEYAIASYAFAYAMSFSNEGHHRRNRSGGTNRRKNVEIFCDAFLGKLGEFAVFQYFRQHGIWLDYPDVSIEGKGKWDSYDFLYHRRDKVVYIGVKTTKKFGHLLLLETKDWNQNAQYIPNLDNGIADYDDILFVRVDTDIANNLKKQRLYYNNDIDVSVLQKEFNNATYYFDIWHIPINLVRLAIRNKLILNKGDYLQSKRTKMDASNYYIQSGDMCHIQSYIKQLKSSANLADY